MLDPAYRDLVLVNEARTELRGSIAAWLGLLVVTIFLAFEFAGQAEAVPFQIWLGAMAGVLAAWLAAWTRFRLRPPADAEILSRWIPGAKLGMSLCNAVTAGSVWVFMPAAGAELRALMVVLYAWYLIIQFAAATEATQVLGGAVVLVLGSLTAWLAIARPPYFLTLALFLPLFGGTLVAIRRFVRQAVVEATAARAQADASGRDLAAALVVLERERDAKTQFIRAASHDLQQPLQAAALFLDQAGGGARGRPAASLGGARRAVGEARRLVETMLQHLRLESGLVRPRLTSFAASELFSRVLLTQAPAAEAHEVRLSLAGGRVRLHSDLDLVARALENLVANAIRHSGGRRVLIGARARRDHVTLWVVDDGCGLAPGEEARIFLPFEQGAKVGAAGGFGLGLASTQGLVALISGDCGARREVTRGAAFYIRLPRSPAQGVLECAA